jgi:uncharacterized protein (TIGR00369 family)
LFNNLDNPVFGYLVIAMITLEIQFFHSRGGMEQQPPFQEPGALKGANRCFGCGPANDTGLHLEFFLGEDGLVVGLPTVPNTYEGPVGLVHGGIIATMLDEAMSKAVRARGVIAMTRQMEIEYLRPVPSGTPIRIEGQVVRNDGRKHWTEARILNASGLVLATGKGLFVQVRVSRMATGRPDDRPAAS